MEEARTQMSLEGDNHTPKAVRILLVTPYPAEIPADYLSDIHVTCEVALGSNEGRRLLGLRHFDVVLLSSAFDEQARHRLSLLAIQRGLLLTPIERRHIREGHSTIVHRMRGSNSHHMFTAMEAQVAEGILAGLANRDIANAMKRSEGAIKAALQRIFSKLGVRTRAQVVRAMLEGARAASSSD